MEMKEQRLVIARGWEACPETLSSEYELADVIMNTVSMTACTRPAWTRKHQSKGGGS